MAPVKHEHELFFGSGLQRRHKMMQRGMLLALLSVLALTVAGSDGLFAQDRSKAKTAGTFLFKAGEVRDQSAWDHSGNEIGKWPCSRHDGARPVRRSAVR